MGNHKVLKTTGINLRYSMYDFIDAVKKQDIIWDREHENFHNRELRDQAWQQIGLQMCKNFEDASVGEKQEIAKTLLKRWKNTRDSYLRVNRVRQSGEEISRGSYIYEKELSFLLDVKAEHDEIGAFKVDRKTAVKRTHLRIIKTPQKRRRESENQERNSDVVDMGVSIDASIQQNALLEDGLHTTMDTLNCTTNTSTVLPPTQQNFKNESISAIFGANSSAVNTSTNCIDPDPDQAFFDSIKPDMQRMTSDQKLEFKIEVLKILRNFKILPN